MKNFCLLLLLLFSHQSFAQSIAYSHRTTKLAGEDAMFLVPKVGGESHLWILPFRGWPNIQVYNDQLEWQHQAQLPVQLWEYQNITVLPFSKSYYVYKPHQDGRPNSLWKIEVGGLLTDVTEQLTKLKPSMFEDSNTVWQMSSAGSQVYLLGYQYFEKLNKLIVSVVVADSLLQKVEENLFKIDYYKPREVIHRILVVPNSHVLVLKGIGSNTLDLYKVELATGKTIPGTFRSNSRFVSADLLLDTIDSSITVYAQMPARTLPKGLQHNLFLTRVNDSLKQISKPVVVPLQLTNNDFAGFVEVTTNSTAKKWVSMPRYISPFYVADPRIRSAISQLQGGSISRVGKVVNETSYRVQIEPLYVQRYVSHNQGNLKLSSWTSSFDISFDTTLKYDRKFFVQVEQNKSISINNTNYLLFKQNFARNAKGLLLLNRTEKGAYESSLLRVYDKYYYSLPHAAPVNNSSLLVPFVYKREVGLVKIKLPTAQE